MASSQTMGPVLVEEGHLEGEQLANVSAVKQLLLFNNMANMTHQIKIKVVQL